MSVGIQHTVHQLFEELSAVAPYPPGVVAVPDQIQGTSFFPGGTGLWVPEPRILPPMPVGGVMILGHDFHNEAGYKWSRENEQENLRSPTWLNLLRFLEKVPIAPGRCFFTNVYMGLRCGNETTGTFAGSKSLEFVARCRRFFLHQLEVQRPVLVLTLGGHVPRFLAPLAPELARWNELAGFPARDAANLSLIADVRFETVERHRCVVASLIHPSFRPRNVGARRWNGFAGSEAEVEMVRTALALANRESADSRSENHSPPVNGGCPQN